MMNFSKMYLRPYGNCSLICICREAGALYYAYVGKLELCIGYIYQYNIRRIVGGSTGEALVLYINIIRMFVCMCVRELNVRNWLTGYASIVYGSTENLIRWVFKK